MKQTRAPLQSSKQPSELRSAASYKAWETIRRRAAARSAAAVLANKTRKSPPAKAKHSARVSQEALSKWARRTGWHVVFLDSKRGNPRTGIVDAVLVRVAKRSADVLELRLVQLKGGHAGLTPTEVLRLDAAVGELDVNTGFAFHDGTEDGFVFVERPRTTARAR